jgi:hypothetical protein
VQTVLQPPAGEELGEGEAAKTSHLPSTTRKFRRKKTSALKWQLEQGSERRPYPPLQYGRPPDPEDAVLRRHPVGEDDRVKRVVAQRRRGQVELRQGHAGQLTDQAIQDRGQGVGADRVDHSD